MPNPSAAFCLFAWLVLSGPILPGIAAAEPGPVKGNRLTWTDWAPCPSNPVLRPGASGEWDENMRERMWVIKEDGRYHAWYTGWQGRYDKNSPNLLHLGYATSDDGIKWTKHAGNPIFADRWTEDPCVVKRDDTYYMYAEDESGDRTVIHLLTSRDRMNWKAHGTVLSGREEVAWDTKGVGSPVVWRASGKKWNMFYDAWPQGVIAIATSEDGKKWSRTGDNRLLTPAIEKEWKTQSIVPNSIIRVDGQYHLFYHANDRAYHTGHATSLDLREWIADNANPILQDKSPVILDAGDAYFLYTSKDGTSGEINLYTSPKGTPATALPPETPKQPAATVYHGVTVTDEYRWLEDGNDPEVKKWSDAENAYARSILDHLPHVAPIRARVTEILSARTVSYSSLEYRAGKLFAIQREPPKEQPFLIVMSSPEAPQEARILVDPNKIDAAGTTSIDWYVPSPDGRLVAVSLSHAGTEAGDVHLFETTTGKQVHEVIPRVNTGTAGGDLAWLSDGNGFFYTRHPRPGEKPATDLDFFQQAYFHEIGTSTENDRYELGKDFPRVAEIQFEMDNASGMLLAAVQNGDGGDFAHFLRLPKGRWVRLADFKAQIKQATFGTSGDLFLISRDGAPRGKIVRVALSKIDLTDADRSDFNVSRLDDGVARTIVPEGKDTIVTSFYHAAPSLLTTEDRLFVIYQTGGPSELRVFDLEGKPLDGPEQQPLSSVGGLTRFEEGEVLFSSTSYVEPPAYHRFSARTGTTGKAVLATTSPVDFRDVEVVREFAISKDGTKVPVNILIPKTARRDGPNPALVTGYGGYGVSLSPSFSAVRHVLMEQGMIWAIANLRGGGEYGEPWHLEGNLTHKQNVFDDFAAVLRHMIDRGYTSAKKLAIEGGSNGGLLMGATLTQHPALVKTVVSHVGIYDMLRVELSPNGVFNIAEFGSVENLDQFRALRAYSPYHHVEVDVPYPSVLFLTGANDPRVDPMQSRKMTAKLQSVVRPEVPILLRTSSNSGHGAGTGLSERIEQTVDVFAFIFDQLGVEYRKKR